MASASETRPPRWPGFTTWLKNQVHRHDLVGDLAGDVACDPDWPKYITATNGYEKVWKYFTYEGACEGAWDGFDQAWHEWRSLDPEYDGQTPSWSDYEPAGWDEISDDTVQQFVAELDDDSVRRLIAGDQEIGRAVVRLGLDPDGKGGCTLYRIYDAFGVLLYVGISNNPGRRLPDHEAVSSWWPQSASASFEHYSSRTAALTAEAEAIRTERPRHNIVHNKGRTAHA